MIRLIAAAASIVVALSTALIVRSRRKQAVADWPIEHRPRSRPLRKSAGIHLPTDNIDLDDHEAQPCAT
jgi:hypothetical protein